MIGDLGLAFAQSTLLGAGFAVGRVGTFDLFLQRSQPVGDRCDLASKLISALVEVGPSLLGVGGGEFVFDSQ
ncbi:hypothetical protein GCM10029978_066190 [Actinoallomurus acanthiterrae]